MQAIPGRRYGPAGNGGYQRDPGKQRPAVCSLCVAQLVEDAKREGGGSRPASGQGKGNNIIIRGQISLQGVRRTGENRLVHGPRIRKAGAGASKRCKE